uniref:Uncharacterized protein n=1 Tax=Candidozyma auris TaxID=498019 RepID=A0A0L0NZB2_CANAR
MVEPKTNVMKLTIVKKVKSMKILLLSSVKRIARGMRTFFFFFSFCVDALLGGTFEDIEIRGNQYSVEGECKFEPKLLPIEKVVVIEKKFFISLFYVVNVIACSNIEGPNDVDINTEGTLFSVRIFIVGEFGPAIIPEIWHGPHI